MGLIEQMNQRRYLFLAEIGEPNDNVLRLVIAEARASDTVEDLQIGDVTIPNTRRLVSDNDARNHSMWSSRLMVHQGTADRSLPQGQTATLIKNLKARHIPTEADWYEGADHGFLAYTPAV